MKANTAKGYQFSIANGVVTKVFEVKNGYAKLEKMESNESWSVSGTSIIKTENEHGRTEITVYSDADGDGIFTKVSEKSSAGPLLTVDSSADLAKSNTEASSTHDVDKGYHVNSMEKSTGTGEHPINGVLLATDSLKVNGFAHPVDSDDLNNLLHESTSEHVVEGKEIKFSSGPEDVEFLRKYLETHHLENSNGQTSEMPESLSLEVELIGVSAPESGDFPM